MVNLRPASPPDAEAMLSIARSLPEWFNDQGLLEMARDFQVQDGIVAVAGHGETAQVVGFVTWGPSPSTPEPGLVELTWLGVTPRLQGQGVGRMLVEALEDRCRQAGATVLQVSTLADSVDYAPYAGTRAFYRRLGFRDWRVDPAFYGPDGDRLLLRKDL